jgi:short-subunit dehydrogenase
MIARMTAPTYGRALVTGASSGIGEAFAHRLAAAGTDLVLVARRADVLERLAAELRAAHGITAEVVAADLATDLGVHAVAERVGDVVLLVNNAGFGIAKRLAEVDGEAVADMIRLNVLALARLTHAAVPGMVARRRGAIVNVSSVAGFSPSPSYASYNGTKAFVTMFTEALAIELRGSGVRVQVLCPGLTHTGFQDVAGETGTDGLPSFMWQEPDEVAAASLDALRGNKVVVTPGLPNKAFVTATSLAPRGVLRRVAGIVMSRRGR